MTMIPACRQEFRDWLDAGMPDHPLFAPGEKSRGCLTDTDKFTNGRVGAATPATNEIDVNDVRFHAVEPTHGRRTGADEEWPETDNA